MIYLQEYEVFLIKFENYLTDELKNSQDTISVYRELQDNNIDTKEAARRLHELNKTRDILFSEANSLIAEIVKPGFIRKLFGMKLRLSDWSLFQHEAAIELDKYKGKEYEDAKSEYYRLIERKPGIEELIAKVSQLAGEAAKLSGQAVKKSEREEIHLNGEIKQHDKCISQQDEKIRRLREKETMLLKELKEAENREKKSSGS